MSTTRITMPQLGESVHEGTISRWLVQPGGQLTEFEPMLEVDTDKVNAEVPAPVTGTLKEILAQEGETVKAGAEIAVVEVGVEPPPAADAATSPPSGEDPSQALPSSAEESGLPGGEDPSEALPRSAGESGRRPGGGDAEHRYSPAVMMLAGEHGVDLANIRGTGLGGRVTKKDVLRAVQGDRPGAAPPLAPPASGEGDTKIPLTRIRRLIAENMTRSKQTIPHAWQTQEVDMSGVVANRAANKKRFQEQEGYSLTYLPYVIKAAATALREHPQVNATFGGEELVVHRDVHIGVSVGLEDTLVVPVIRQADGLSLAGIARAVADVAQRARDKKLKADDLAGATFTVNNSGTFGTLFSYSVINPGQAGILTMEAIVDRPMAVQGMIGIKPMMYLCFSFDHRVLDGLQAARFLTSCRLWLEGVTAETPIW
ncbi:MAG TPA: dihydrolipoamide acetyltransferase family protein [Candidatus Dormibacteraeota bacterium]